MTEDEGGDPACWLHQVCEACGAFIDRDERHDCPQAPPPTGTAPAGGEVPADPGTA